MSTEHNDEHNPDQMDEQHRPQEAESDVSDFERLQRLVDFLKASGVVEYTSERESEHGARRLSLKFAGAHTAAPAAPPVYAAPAPPPAAAAPAPAAAAAPAAPAAAPADEEAGWHIVKSPIVGTFYESPSPGAPIFVNIGDHVTVGQTLCIVEAMKLMNDIESDGAGEVVKRYVQNGQPVEYGQKLFALKG